MIIKIFWIIYYLGPVLKAVDPNRAKSGVELTISGDNLYDGEQIFFVHNENQYICELYDFSNDQEEGKVKAPFAKDGKSLKGECDIQVASLVKEGTELPFYFDGVVKY